MIIRYITQFHQGMKKLCGSLSLLCDSLCNNFLHRDTLGWRRSAIRAEQGTGYKPAPAGGLHRVSRKKMIYFSFWV